MKLISCALVMILSQPAMGIQEVSSSQYLKLSAREKKDRIVQNCLEETTPAVWKSLGERLNSLLEQPICPTIQTVGDELPINRDKHIHSALGTVALVEWQTRGGHPFTGMFQGAMEGIVRLSLSREPDPSRTFMITGMGLKFLRDAMDSANLVAMFSLDGQESFNFFQNNQTTRIPPSKNTGTVPNVLVEVKFAQATMFIQQIGLSNWAMYDESGATVYNPVFPYSLRFQPTGEIMFSDTYVRPHVEDMLTIPKGSILYKVYARDKPEELGGKEMPIADLVTVSDMTTSLWGDKNLFFRHQDMKDDLALRPEWRPYIASFGIEHRGCPGIKVTEA